MHIFIDNFGNVIKDDKYRQVKEETGLTDKELINLIKNGAIIEGSKVNLSIEELIIIGKIYDCVIICSCDWKEKIKNLMVGLEAEHIDKFIKEANTQMYLEYGIAYMQRVKEIIGKYNKLKNE